MVVSCKGGSSCKHIENIHIGADRSSIFHVAERNDSKFLLSASLQNSETAVLSLIKCAEISGLKYTPQYIASLSEALLRMNSVISSTITYVVAGCAVVFTLCSFTCPRME